MRIDVVSIFPDYLLPLQLSLPGKAIRDGLVELAVHDLRGWTDDRHRTVDDSPYGGGAGMVMKPGPWGDALDELVAASATPESVLVVPTPSGRPFDQALARDLAGAAHLVVACGRYEGIDQRVVDHYRSGAGGSVRVEEVSLGDFVLNGGEVAALAVIEAVVRLLPGFMGNPESLAEESHDPETGGLLEYPVYTKPASWRGLDVPAVLLSGDHGRVATWRHEQSLRRTVARRPDLLPATALTGLGAVPDLELTAAVPADVPEWHVLQLACWVTEQQANPGTVIPTLHETVDDVRAWWPGWTVRVLRTPQGRLVGGFRGRLVEREDGPTWEVGRLMVAPDLRGRGVGRSLLAACEELAPDEAVAWSLITGASSERNHRLYRRAGYRRGPAQEPGAVRFTKRRRVRPGAPPTD
ncbi:tRNA (guanosine(37)-N1)-methyltransferase TrmD [Nocardioidaceae bacterium]|nr:tRNA (guanosine(37)-N1)-methyltransferase TrmD [Nocardioidaceae bacterium]